MSESIRLFAHWPDSPLTTGQYTELAKTLLTHVQDLHPKLASLSLWGKRSQLVPLVPPFDNLYETLVDTKFGHRRMADFRDLDERKRVTPQSTNGFGMTMNAFGDLPEHESHGSGSGYGRIEASLSSGSYFEFATSDFKLFLPDETCEELQTEAFVRRAIQAIIAALHPTLINVDSVAFSDAAYGERLEGHGRGNRCVWPGWMTYLRVPGLDQHLPGDIDHESLPDGGLILFSSRERPEASDSLVLTKARRILAVLEDFGLVQNTVTLWGWPTFEDEVRYASQITGAPPDRVYRVALSEFSGWDRDRQVLLWAHLFPYWNADRFHWSPQQVKPLDTEPVVAEASKQLRSLELVGSNVPIEWHIGRSELVEPIRTLLHRHAGIDEARLRVVSTPYRE